MEEFNRELAEILEVDDVRPADVLATFEAWDSLSVLSVIVMIRAKVQRHTECIRNEEGSKLRKTSTTW